MLGILVIIAIIIPFLILPFWWAVAVLIWDFLIGPTSNTFLFKIIPKSQKLYWFESGFVECLALFIMYFLLKTYFTIPTWFMSVIVAKYTATQVYRAFDNGMHRESGQQELKELAGYIFGITIFTIFITIFL